MSGEPVMGEPSIVAIVDDDVSTQQSLNTSFRQRMAALGPYLDEQSRLKLTSQWALMRSRADYELIANDMDARGHAAKILLPGAYAK